MSTEQTPEAEVIVDIAREAERNLVEVGETGVQNLVLVPTGQKPELLDLDPYQPVPRRARGTVNVATVDSLVAYVKKHDNADTSTLWVHPDNGKIVAVLNDHGPDGGATNGAGWGDHRALLTLQPTPEWEAWQQLDGRQLPQERFAEHIEDRLVDIVQPSGADLLDIVQTLTGATAVEWKSGTRLQDGTVQLRYEETMTAKAGQKGDLEIPSVFVLAIAPFLGEPRTDITARLRYRMPSESLTIGFKLDRPEDVVRQVITSLTGRLGDEFGADRVFIGEPR